MTFAFALPVKPYVKKYLIHRYGTAQNPHISVRKRTFLGDMVSACVVKNPMLNANTAKPTGCHVILYFSTDTKLLEIPQNKLQHISSMLERKFREDLCTFVMGYYLSSHQQMFAVKEFLKAFDIDEDELPLDTAWKIWRDFEVRIERERQKIFRSSVGEIQKTVGKSPVSSTFSVNL